VALCYALDVETPLDSDVVQVRCLTISELGAAYLVNTRQSPRKAYADHIKNIAC
jgi:hypothetical protein